MAGNLPGCQPFIVSRASPYRVNETACFSSYQVSFDSLHSQKQRGSVAFVH